MSQREWVLGHITGSIAGELCFDGWFNIHVWMGGYQKSPFLSQDRSAWWASPNAALVREWRRETFISTDLPSAMKGGPKKMPQLCAGSTFNHFRL